MQFKAIQLIFLTIAVLLLPSCRFSNLNRGRDTEHDTLNPLIDLVESTHIIRTLIIHNKIESILEDSDPEKLVVLLDNISPAKMAFESEVLATIIPLVVVYYFENNDENSGFIQELKKLAVEYNNIIKFVIINAERLFSLAQDAEIVQLPTILLIKEREIIKRIEGNIAVDQLSQILNGYRTNQVSNEVPSVLK